jgi:hypothetical protein
MRKQVEGQAGSQPVVPGTVYADAVYRADELKARMGWREAAFRAACRRGLKTHRVGKRVYITGADAIAFVTGKEVAK